MLSILLFPFALLYGLIARGRNLFYDLGWKKSYSFTQVVISVGNLNVGGTGKTPMIEYLVNLLMGSCSLAILSRGYGRSTHGFLLAEKHDDATTLGDEPFQFYRKFGNFLNIAVCESRVEGINQLLKKRPEVQVVLLDDAFQHRAVKPSFSILLTDFSKPFFNDYLLPYGRLRESRAGSKRADVVIATKCNPFTEDVRSEFSKNLQAYTGNKPIFFSGIRYKTPVALEGHNEIGKKIILVSGIANSKPLEDYVSTLFTVVYHFQFNDHYAYSTDDITMIQNKSSNTDAPILTTEKDMARLISMSNTFKKKLWFYLPIETYFLNSGAEFDKLVLEKVKLQIKTPSIKLPN
jgi:tetraacyldisaccharide 4'-kinase